MRVPASQVPSTGRSRSSRAGMTVGSAARSDQVGAHAGAQHAPLVLLERLVGDAGGVGGQRVGGGDPLGRQPAAVRVPCGGLPGRRGGDAGQGLVGGDRPVAAERHAGAGTQQAGDLVLPGAAGGADAGQGQLGHQRVGLGPQRLEVRDHAEGGEAGQVGRVDELDVGHGGPPVGRAVAPGRLGDRVQGQADPRVADGVHVGLEAQRVGRGHRVGELVRRPVSDPVRVRAVVVGLEQRGGAGLHDAVGEELHRPGGQPARGAAADPVAVRRRARRAGPSRWSARPGTRGWRGTAATPAAAAASQASTWP